MRVMGWWLLWGLAGSAILARADEGTLVDAVKKRDRARAAALLDAGATDAVNAAAADGMTPLHWAVYHDDVDLTRRLIASQANVNAKNRYGVAPLSLACENGNDEIVEALLASGAEANGTLRGGETPLMTAARTGRLKAIGRLLAHGADVHARERKGQTAIMWAAAEGHVEVVDALLAAGAEFKKPLPSGFTPFFFAVRQGHATVVSRLLEAGVDVNDAVEPERPGGGGLKAGTSALLLAVENGHFQLADQLLAAGADPNDQRAGYTALHALTWVRKPIRGDGDPPPLGSGKLNSLELVRKLVERGANVNARHGKKHAGGPRLNRVEATPLLLAAEASDVPLLRLLVELGADPTIANADGSTPLLAAAGVGVLSDGDESAGTEEEALETAKFLLDLGADPDVVDAHGNTAMHGAAYQSRAKLVTYLAQRGADRSVWNQKNRRGWTPLLIAQGHRPGNFRPSADTIAALEAALK